MAGKKPLFSADAAEEYFSTLLTYYRNTDFNKVIQAMELVAIDWNRRAGEEEPHQ